MYFAMSLQLSIEASFLPNYQKIAMYPLNDKNTLNKNLKIRKKKK